jgi:hypothetical protein
VTLAQPWVAGKVTAIEMVANPESLEQLDLVILEG